MKVIMETVTWAGVILFLVFILFIHGVAFSGGIIIDHTCTDIRQVPEYWINKAKSDFKMSYGHTSHGSQIVTGMNLLKGAPGFLYWFDHNGNDGGLSLHDYEPSGDLGNPDRTTWATRTRTLLNNPDNDRNLIMWSWCGQVSYATESDINTYLTLMNQLEQDYPNVIFVYMTGHLDGTGETENLHIRNNQIRSFCTANNKVLFDFADIESYDPDENYFLNRGADDVCDYDGGNWADQWCAANPGECNTCSCAHSRCLNCQQKGKAFWWMMAKIAGWNSSSTTTTTTSTTSTTSTSASTTSTTTLPTVSLCSECSGSPVILTDVTFNSETNCECTDATSITIGPGVIIRSGANITFDAPVVNIKSYFQAEINSAVSIKKQ